LFNLKVVFLTQELTKLILKEWIWESLLWSYNLQIAESPIIISLVHNRSCWLLFKNDL